jgi:hypothetical protein
MLAKMSAPPKGPISSLASGATIPFFQITGEFHYDNIPKRNFYEEYIDTFTTANLSAFNPTVHLQLESEEASEGELDPMAYLAEQDEDPLKGKVKVARVRNLNRIWMSVTPECNKFSEAINDALL